MVHHVPIILQYTHGFHQPFDAFCMLGVISRYVSRRVPHNFLQSEIPMMIPIKKNRSFPALFWCPDFSCSHDFPHGFCGFPPLVPPKVATSLRTGRRGCSVWCDWLRAPEPSPRWPREAGQPGELVLDEWNIPEVMFFRWVIFTIYPGIWVNI